jgi:predicted DNA-binding transcriptional regulator YafY
VGKPTKLQRWLDLIAVLVGQHFPVSADELMRSVPSYAKGWASDDPKDQESTRRAFERDKDELRKRGIPIRSVQYTVDGIETEGYQINRRDFYLPYLEIVKTLTPSSNYVARLRESNVQVTESEAPYALDALRRVNEIPGFPLAREARSAFRKLAFDIDIDSFSARSTALFMDQPGAAEMSETVRVLSDALTAKKRVTFLYHGIHRGHSTQRDVAGYGLMFQHGHWYLVGHDATRNDIRVFRVGRMENVQANAAKPNTADYQVPRDFRLRDYGDRDPWEFGEHDETPLAAHVRFRFPLSLWAERNAHGTLVSREEDGAQIRAFALRQVEPFIRWILGFEGEADIVSPDSLRAEYRTFAQKVADAHGAARGAART